MILDYNMPGMDGLEVLRAIRAEPRYGSVRVILFTAQESDRLRQAAMDAGADAFVLKGSLDYAQLERLVEQHCQPTRPPVAPDPPAPPERKETG